MRRTYIFLFLVVFSFLSLASGFNQALNMARMTEKDVLLFFYDPQNDIWQDFSQQFFNRNTLNILTKDYYLVFLDSNKYQNLSAYFSLFVPNTVIIVDAKGQEIDRLEIDHVPGDEFSFINTINSLRDSTESLLQLKRKERKYPRNYYFKYRLSEKYLERRKLKKSELLLIDTINLYPTYKKAYITLSSLYRMTGNFDEAISILNIAEKLDFENNRILLEKAKTYLESGHPDMALEQLMDISRPTWEMIYETDLLKVYAYSLLGDRKKARESLEKIEDISHISIYTKYAREFYEERFD